MKNGKKVDKREMGLTGCGYVRSVSLICVKPEWAMEKWNDLEKWAKNNKNVKVKKLPYYCKDAILI